MNIATSLGFLAITLSAFTADPPALAAPPRGDCDSAACRPPRFLSFDAPGAGSFGSQGTVPSDINEAGEIVGHVVDLDGSFHGFLRTPSGRITGFDVPGAGNLDTVPAGLNPRGTVVGSFSDANGVYHGFIRERGGRMTTFDASSGGLDTFPTAISREGVIVGYYLDITSAPHAFMRTAHGAIVNIEPQGLTASPTMNSVAYSVNAGAAAGEFQDANGIYHGFIRGPDASIAFDAPGAGTAASQGTFAGEEQALNSHGQTAGPYADSASAYHGYLRHRDGSFTVFDATLDGLGTAIVTIPLSLNSRAMICGYGLWADGSMHGFLRSRGGRTAAIDAPAGGGAPSATLGTYPFAVNDSATVTGFSVDGSGVYHGFVFRGGDE